MHIIHCMIVLTTLMKAKAKRLLKKKSPKIFGKVVFLCGTNLTDITKIMKILNLLITTKLMPRMILQ